MKLPGYKSLANEGYGSLWLGNTPETAQIVLKLPGSESFLPYTLSNEIGWLRLLEQHDTIAAPRVLAYSVGGGLQILDASITNLLPANLVSVDSQSSQPFIAMTKIEGEQLCKVWMRFTEVQKANMAKQIAEFIVNLAEIKRSSISSLAENMDAAPPTEHPRFLNGRFKIYGQEHLYIGPYDDLYTYVAANLSRELLFYTSPLTKNGVDLEPFSLYKTSIEEHICNMRELHEEIKHQSHHHHLPPTEYCGVHGDLAGRNIHVSYRVIGNMSQPFISGVLDFEWSNFCPISEVNAEPVFVMEDDNPQDRVECSKWSHEITRLVIEEARRRDWDESHIAVIQETASDTDESSSTDVHSESDNSPEEKDSRSDNGTTKGMETELDDQVAESSNETLSITSLQSRQADGPRVPERRKLNLKKLAELASGLMEPPLVLSDYLD